MPFSVGLLNGLQWPYGMNHTFKSAVATLMSAVSFAGSVAAGPFEAAVAAYEKGVADREKGVTDNEQDLTAHEQGVYATALRLLRPLAQQGEARCSIQSRAHVRQRPGRAAGLRDCGDLVSQGRRARPRCRSKQSWRNVCPRPRGAAGLRGCGELVSKGSRARATPWLNTISGSCTRMARVCRRTTRSR